MRRKIIAIVFCFVFAMPASLTAQIVTARFRYENKKYDDKGFLLNQVPPPPDSTEFVPIRQAEVDFVYQPTGGVATEVKGTTNEKGKFSFDTTPLTPGTYDIWFRIWARRDTVNPTFQDSMGME